MHPLNQSKIVFDIEGKPELAHAILTRLQEIGVALDDNAWRDIQDSDIRNISLGADPKEAFVGAVPVDSSYFWEYQIWTLDQLFDLPLQVLGEHRPAVPEEDYAVYVGRCEEYIQHVIRLAYTMGYSVLNIPPDPTWLILTSSGHVHYSIQDMPFRMRERTCLKYAKQIYIWELEDMANV